MTTHQPIDLLLFCPACGLQHIDQPQPEKNWDNPPHRSHECQGCGHVWRPADVATNGVAAIQTKGTRDGSPAPAQQAGDAACQPFRMLMDAAWVRRAAELEDGCEVGAGMLHPEAPQQVTARIKEVMAECPGHWHSCTGCYEGEDGQNVHRFPYSQVFQCIVGSGCSECGGIGAVWDNTDYAGMAKEMLAEDEAQQATDAERGKLADRLEATMHKAEIEGWPWIDKEAYKRIAALLRAPAVTVDDAMIQQVALQISNDIAELSDRTSPENQPDMMLVTEKELQQIIVKRLEAALKGGA